MKELLVIVFISIGLASLWEPVYQKCLSELDKINKGKGTQVSLRFLLKRGFIATLMFLFAYITTHVNVPALHGFIYFMLFIALISVVLGAYMLHLNIILLGSKKK